MEGCLKFFIVAIVAVVLIYSAFHLISYFLLRSSSLILPLIGLGTITIVAAIVVTQVRAESARKSAERDRRRSEEERRLAEKTDRLQQLREQQRRYCHEMESIANQSMDAFETTPGLLIEAERLLDQAEVDHRESAFSPFWDTIEKAANRLARFDEIVHRINSGSTRYAELVKLYAGIPHSFPLSSLAVSRLNTGTQTAARLKLIVRKAQRDFQFASIYEQRKTNQILVAGFTNLAQALDRMSSEITASIDTLSASIDTLSETVVRSSRGADKNMSEIRDAIADLHTDTTSYQSQQAQREKKVSEMLDNIQRGRKPLVDPPPMI